MEINKLGSLVILLASITMAGCASNKSAQLEQVEQTDASLAPVEKTNDIEQSEISDPIEPFNRLMWDFNYDILDRFLLKPLTKGYVAVMPQPIRTGLVNAANNIEEPANSINNMLQGKFEGGFTSVGRFAVNSTVGLLGFFDVASKMGLERQREDFGQVLGVWGVGTGPYLMLPALGPSDIRSFSGRVIDSYYWPSTVLEDPYLIGAAMVSIIEARATLLEQEENLNRALDPYLFVRDVYFQRLAFEVSDGKIEQKSNEELEEEEEDFSDFEALLNGTE